MSLNPYASVLVLGIVCFAAAPALAAPVVVSADASSTVTPKLPTHGLGGPPSQAKTTAGTATSSAGTVSATNRVAAELPASAERKTATDAAQDSAAAVATTTCDAYFAQSAAMSSSLGDAFRAMQAHDITTLGTLLPGLKAQLSGLPMTEIKPETCDGTHINAYTQYQYFELSVLRARSVNTGLPATLPLVKQPALNQALLPYAIGWTLFEQKDFEGALAVYSKGLAMFPHDHNLQNEYAATLLALGRNADGVAYIDSVLNGTYDLSDEDRAKLFAGRGFALFLLDRFDEADSAYTVAQSYNYTDSTKQMQEQLQTARAKK